MKLLLILITTIVSFTVKGQDAKPKHKILVGYSVAPGYGFRTLKNNDGSPSSDIVINSRNDVETGRFVYSTGVNVLINFSDRVGLETGLLFSNKGYKTKSLDLTYFPPDPNLPTKARFSFSYQYLGIPLKARFSFGKSKLRFVSSLGVVTNFLLNVRQTTKYEYADGKTDEQKQSTTSGFKKVDISALASVGVDYTLNDKIHLIAEPTFVYGLIKTRDTPVTEHLRSIGLNIGFYYGLR